MESDFAIGCQRDKDLAAIALGDFGKIPLREMRSVFQHHNVCPAIAAITLFPLRDRLFLQRPESFGIGKIGFFAKQVGYNCALVFRDIEQRRRGGNLLAAEKPQAQSPSLRCVAVRIAEALEPCFLLFRCRHGQNAQGFAPDFLATVENQNPLIEIRQGKALFHQSFAHVEMGDDILDAPASRDQCGKCLILVDFIHGQTPDIFGQGGLDGGGIIALFHDGARQRRGHAFVNENAIGFQAPLSGHDLERPVLLPHEKRLQDAEGANGGDEIAHIRRAVFPDIEGGHAQTGIVDMGELHCRSPFGLGFPREKVRA